LDWKLHLKRLMFVQGIIYGGFGIYSLIFHNQLMSFLGLSEVLEPFWLFIAVSLLFTLSVICFGFYFRPERIAYVEVVILAKFIDAALMLIYFLISLTLGYLVGFLVDFSLGALIIMYFIKATK
jgi:hypothetical protein